VRRNESLINKRNPGPKKEKKTMAKKNKNKHNKGHDAHAVKGTLEITRSGIGYVVISDGTVMYLCDRAVSTMHYMVILCV
jgi:hypothetical protein